MIPRSPLAYVTSERSSNADAPPDADNTPLFIDKFVPTFTPPNTFEAAVAMLIEPAADNDNPVPPATHTTPLLFGIVIVLSESAGLATAIVVS